ncbi:hypothetical protein MYCTH_95223 [Thermothelomyces thermophilus ATCC 42464]|uniref:Uncharacterized protein n=1 Tax=Thermothelomyces thermophilus (strain ATCC 42464 / BCRC 31852 / DSM 1799) TaxID=573729 RepID=G2QH22_THET4|nr:uncharacterized protein MYCTH_95223 [Thermothelomyces thermophilus ATCC 42464]AEO58682.1 hypothetical protein MYCTH_95223 [Thermothelomyces thermophilus ATCC 42464]
MTCSADIIQRRIAGLHVTSRNTYLRGYLSELATIRPDDSLANIYHIVSDVFLPILVDLASVSSREPMTKALGWELTPTQPSTPSERHGQTVTLRRRYTRGMANGPYDDSEQPAARDVGRWLQERQLGVSDWIGSHTATPAAADRFRWAGAGVDDHERSAELGDPIGKGP